MSVQMGRPATWTAFKNFPQDIQEEYLGGLIEKYGANIPAVADMFRVTPACVRNYLTKNGMNPPFKRSMSAEQRRKFKKFVFGAEEQGAEEPAQQMEACEREEPKSPDGQMRMRSFSISFDGPIDVNMVANSLRRILGDNPRGSIRVECSLADEDMLATGPAV